MCFYRVFTLDRPFSFHRYLYVLKQFTKYYYIRTITSEALIKCICMTLPFILFAVAPFFSRLIHFNRHRFLFPAPSFFFGLRIFFALGKRNKFSTLMNFTLYLRECIIKRNKFYDYFQY